jgi:hypothetical protein
MIWSGMDDVSFLLTQIVPERMSPSLSVFLFLCIIMHVTMKLIQYESAFIYKSSDIEFLWYSVQNLDKLLSKD